MRLLNLYTLQFEEFYGEADTPAYAILSHRWSKGEVSYRDFVDARDQRSAAYEKILDFCTFALGRPTGIWNKKRWLSDSVCDQRSAGYKKILDFCVSARSRPAKIWNKQRKFNEFIFLQWGWLDTICIDKTNSQELRRVSTACSDDEGDSVVAEAFAESEWFDRGWTLQELLAPQNVVFCNRAWQVIGHKCTHQIGNFSVPCSVYDHKLKIYGPSLNTEISRPTKIDSRYLRTPVYIFGCSVACRMSWAARRKTARIEDMAYCLLGILNVNMPLLYGEGHGAFIRLQEELIRRSSDQSIFHWNPDPSIVSGCGSSSVLASGPADFAESSNIIVNTNLPPDAPYTLTNIGLEIKAKTTWVWNSDLERDVFAIQLKCGHYPAGNLSISEGREEDFVPSVLFIASTGSSARNAYERVYFSPQALLTEERAEVAERQFYVRTWGRFN
ncbi:hypothetical protein LTR17_015823 [Elasticomyces elasticus]|nr:hypothetical protein LTR17_015823 [Elasticomyces elasticus]